MEIFSILLVSGYAAFVSAGYAPAIRELPVRQPEEKDRMSGYYSAYAGSGPRARPSNTFDQSSSEYSSEGSSEYYEPRQSSGYQSMYAGYKPSPPRHRPPPPPPPPPPRESYGGYGESSYGYGGSSSGGFDSMMQRMFRSMVCNAVGIEKYECQDVFDACDDLGISCMECAQMLYGEEDEGYEDDGYGDDGYGDDGYGDDGYGDDEYYPEDQFPTEPNSPINPDDDFMNFGDAQKTKEDQTAAFFSR